MFVILLFEGLEDGDGLGADDRPGAGLDGDVYLAGLGQGHGQADAGTALAEVLELAFDELAGGHGCAR